MRAIPSTLLVLLTAVAAAAPAVSQVRPAEPFGGRPFGAPPGTPAASSSATDTATMGAQGMSSVTAPGTPNLGTPPTVVVTPVQVAAPPPPPPPAPAPAPTPAPAPSPVAAQGMPPNAAVPSTPSPAITPTPLPSGPAMSAVPAPAAASIAQPFGGASRNAPAVAASTAQQPPVRGLPADAPKLVISGSVYSPDPAKRILIVNGQLMREGADLGQGVVLQEVRQEGAVLGFKGSKYNVAF